MGKGKKFLSLFLAAAMTVTGINVGVPATAHAQTAEEAVSLPKKLAFFSFDNENGQLSDGSVITADDGIVSGDDGEAGSEQKVNSPGEGTQANVTATVSGTGASLQTGDKRAGTKALKLSGNTFLTVMAGEDNLLNGREELTVSFWSKVEGSGRNWPFYAGKVSEDPTAKDGHIGVAYNGNTVLFSRGKGAIVSGGNAEASGDNAAAGAISGSVDAAGEWNFITVVMSSTSSTLYINGEEASEGTASLKLSELLDDKSRLQIGKANIGAGEFFKGYIDDFSLYGTGLSSAEVQADYESYFKKFPVNYVCGEEVLKEKAGEATFKYDRSGAFDYAYELTQIPEADKKILVGEDEKPYVLDEDQAPIKLTKDDDVVNVQYTKAFQEYTVKYVTGEGEEQKQIADSKEAWFALADSSAEDFVYELTDAEKKLTHEGTVYVAKENQGLRLNAQNEIVVEYVAEVNKVAIKVNYVYEEGGNSIDITTKTVSVDKVEDDEYTYGTVSPDDGRIVSDEDFKVYTPKSGQENETAQPVEGKEGEFTLTIKCDKKEKTFELVYKQGENRLNTEGTKTEPIHADDVAGKNKYTYTLSNQDATFTYDGKEYTRKPLAEQSGLTVGEDATQIIVEYNAPAELGEIEVTIQYKCGNLDVAAETTKMYTENEANEYKYTLVAADKRRVKDGKVYKTAEDVTEVTAELVDDKYVITIEYTETKRTFDVEYKCGDVVLNADDANTNKIEISASDADGVDTYTFDPSTARETYEYEQKIYTRAANQEPQVKTDDESGAFVVNYDAPAESGEIEVTIQYKCGDLDVADEITKTYTENEANEYKYTLVAADKRRVKDGKVYKTAEDVTEVTAELVGDKYVITIQYTQAEKTFDVTYKCNGSELNQNPTPTVTLPATDDKGVDVYTFDPQTAPQTITIEGKRYDRKADQSVQTRRGENNSPFTVEYTLFKATLIADYSFDAEGDSWADATENKGNAVKEGQVTSVQGLVGNAVQLPGGNSNDKYPGVIKLPDNLLEGLDDFTISVFTKRTSDNDDVAISLLGSDGHTNWKDTAARSNAAYIGLLNRSSQLCIKYKTVGVDEAGTADASKTPKDKWVHFVMVVSGSTDKVYLYQDGQKVLDHTFNGLNPSAMAQKNNYLGRSIWEDPDYSGAFDELKVYNGALSAEEAQAVYSGEMAQVEKQEFLQLIETAEELVTTTDATYPQSARDALILAIATAKNASDAELAEASQALQNAIDAFRAAAVDKAALQAKIAEAEGKVGNTDYPDAARKALQAAINAAKEAEGLTTTTQAAIAKATSDLTAAIATFELSKDKKALTDRIEEAKHKANDTSYSEEARDTLKEAIAQAQAAADNATTVTELKEALIDLNTAITAFEDTKPGPVELDKEALRDKIAEATQKVADTSYSETARNNLANAVLVAQLVLNNATTQKEIDDALSVLEGAIKIFEASKVELNKKDLTDKITEATQKVSDTSYTEEARKALADAIAAAEEAAKNATTQKELDDALEALNEAITTFEASDKVVNKTELDSVIQAVSALKENDYTPSTWKTLKDALTAAQEINAKADATQEEVNNALNLLNDAKSKLVKATKVKKLTIAGNKKLRIAAGQKVSLKAVVAPENATNKTLKWRVGKKNKKNASVDQNGVVTTTQAGAGKKVVVAVRSQDGSKLRAAVTVVIMKHAVKSVKLSAKDKTVKNGAFTAKVGEKVKLVPEIKTTGKKANKDLTWKSSNNKYVKVGSKGVVKVKEAGKGKTVTITATSTDGTNKKATIKIKIK